MLILGFANKRVKVEKCCELDLFFVDETDQIICAFESRAVGDCNYTFEHYHTQTEGQTRTKSTFPRNTQITFKEICFVSCEKSDGAVRRNLGMGNYRGCRTLPTIC